jgi:DNA-binding response OmpR family regulator
MHARNAPFKAMEFATANRAALLRWDQRQAARGKTVQQPARILVVEDEMLFAETLVGLLQDGGFSAAGPTATVAGALSIMATCAVDAAILDIRLDQERSYRVAYALEERAIPFIFVTACQRRDLPLDLRSRPLIEKPFHPPALLRTLREVLPV